MRKGIAIKLSQRILTTLDLFMDSKWLPCSLFAAILSASPISLAGDAMPLSEVEEAIHSALTTHIEHEVETFFLHQGITSINRTAINTTSSNSASHNTVSQKITILPTLPTGSHRLALCTEQLEITRRDRRFYPGGRLRYEVVCDDGWKVTVPVQVNYTVPIAVATKNLQRDHVITTEDFTMTEQSVSTLHRPYLHYAPQLTDRRLERQVRQGQKIAADRLMPDYVVRRGENVVITAIVDGFEASMPGIAQQSGYLGENIVVRNTTSGKRITAEISANGEVKTRF